MPMALPVSANTLVLASQSPRRRELLNQAGLPFEIHVPQVDETCSLPAKEAVAELSRRKAAACVSGFPGRYILASDTLVCLDGAALGKPHSEEEARGMLQSLSGRTHEVFTGVTVISPDGCVRTDVDGASVSFCPIPSDEIEAYIRSGEPMDKAGAYAIQGSFGVNLESMDGPMDNVIGFPLEMIKERLAALGPDLR